jgi:hypothetical protein
LLQAGEVNNALVEAEKLSQDDPSIGHVLLKMDVQLVKGDLVAFEVQARRLLDRQELTSEQSLRIANLVKHGNHKLAKKFWWRAVESAQDDPDLAPFAFHLAGMLGLENQSASLLHRMMADAAVGQGPLQSVTMKETLEMLSARASHLKQLEQLNQAGEISLQCYAKGGLSLVFRGLAERNKIRDLVGAYSEPIYVRYGGRPAAQNQFVAQAKHWRLHCDETALLLAHELGVLPKIESQFKPLLIPREIAPALVAQCDKLRPAQQAHLESGRLLVDLESRNAISVDEFRTPQSAMIPDAIEPSDHGVNPNHPNDFAQRPEIASEFDSELAQQLGDTIVQLLRSGLASNEFVAAFLPLRGFDGDRHFRLQIPYSMANRLINCRALADCLFGHNLISTHTYQLALKSLGTEGHPIATVTPMVGTRISLAPGIAAVLAEAGILEQLCNSFEVSIPRTCLESAKNLIQHYSRLANVEKWVNELLKRISQGLDDGTYAFIDIPDLNTLSREIETEANNLEARCTIDLFLFEPSDGDIVWVDDRAINKHGARGDGNVPVPIVSIVEILQALRQLGSIEENDYHTYLQQLREADFRYIPLDEPELTKLLSQSRVENGSVRETRALSTIRRYYASCFLDRDGLQIEPKPGQESSTPLELTFVVETIGACVSAIGNIWADLRIDVETAKVRSNWLMLNLYTGNYGCTHLQSRPERPGENLDVAALVAEDICQLLMVGIRLLGNPLALESNQRRNDYFRWMQDQVISTLGSSEKVMSFCVEIVKQRLLFVKNIPVRSVSDEVFRRAYIAKFYLDVSKTLGRDIDWDAEMLEWLQIEVGRLVTVAGLEFSSQDYWNAVAQALSNGSAEIQPWNSDSKCKFLRTNETDLNNEKDDDSTVIAIFDSAGLEVGSLSDPLIGILSTSSTDRRRTVRKLRSWFDCGESEFQREFETIDSIADPVERATHLYDWRASSSEAYYRGLESKLRERKEIPWSELMPPSGRVLAGRFRIPPMWNPSEEPFSKIWATAGDQFLSDLDLMGVLARCASVPVSMPGSVILAVSDLNESEGVGLFKKLFASWRSPLRKLHLVNLVLRIGTRNEEILSLVRQTLSQLFNNESGSRLFESFQAVLLYFMEQFELQEEFKELAPGTRIALVWAHACRIYDLMRAVGNTEKDIVAMMQVGKRTYFRESIFREKAVWRDCANPRRVSRSIFLTHGVAFMLAGVDSTDLVDLEIPRLIEGEFFSDPSNIDSLPKIELVGDSELQDDILGSIFGKSRYAVIGNIIGFQRIQFFSPEYLRKSLDSDLDALTTEPASWRSWVGVKAVAGDLPVYPELVEKLSAVLEAFHPSSRCIEDFGELDFVLRASFGQVINCGNSQLRQRYTNYLDELLQSLIKEADNDETGLPIKVATIVDLAAILSTSEGDPAASAKDFVELVERLAKRWFKFYLLFGSLLSQELWHLPLSEGAPWWRFLYQRRATQ